MSTNYYDTEYYPRKDPKYRNYYNKIVKRLGITPLMKVFDAGCGKGNFLSAVSRSGAWPSGVDMSEKAIDYCKKTILGNFRVEGIDNINYPSGAFDIVTCLGVLEHVENKTAVINELSRISKNCVVFCAPIDEYLLRRFGYKGTEQKKYREDVLKHVEWQSMFESCRLKVVDKFADKRFATIDWVFKKGVLFSTIRLMIAIITLFLPVKMAYQVYFICEKENYE